MAKRSSAVPDSFEVDVVSLLRGQVDAIVHELAVAISEKPPSLAITRGAPIGTIPTITAAPMSRSPEVWPAR